MRPITIPPQAEAQLAAARQIDPGSEETALIANRFYSDMGDTKQAIEVLKVAAGRRPDVAHGISAGHNLRPAKGYEGRHRGLPEGAGSGARQSGYRSSKLAERSAGRQPDAMQALQAWKDVAAGDPTDAEAECRLPRSTSTTANSTMRSRPPLRRRANWRRIRWSISFRKR